MKFSPTLLERLGGTGPALVLTGAGISAESGLATFRGPGGHWEGRNPVELATPGAFSSEPLTVWRFYAWRREQAAAAAPNSAHRALAALERAHDDFLLVTQNVDGLHERSGSSRLVRLHGTLWRLRCVDEGKEFDDRRANFEDLPPKCSCGGLLRPAVVWFGEPLPEEAIQEAVAFARRAAIVLVIGTSSLVYPAAELPMIARSSGAYVVEINPDATPLSAQVDERLAGPAGEIVPALVQAAGVSPESPA